jgi:hypothetical protein
MEDVKVLPPRFYSNEFAIACCGHKLLHLRIEARPANSAMQWYYQGYDNLKMLHKTSGSSLAPTFKTPPTRPPPKKRRREEKIFKGGR